VKCQGFIVVDDFYGQTHLSLQVTLNVRDFVWVLFKTFFKELCIPVMMFCADDFWFGLKNDLF